MRMTDQNLTSETVVAEGTDGTVVVAGQVSDDQGVLAQGAVAAQGDHAIVVARFADQTSAEGVYVRLVELEIEGRVHIDGVLVIKADDKGTLHVQHMTDHSTKTGLKWGLVGGAVAAIFLPATIIGGAVAMGVAGAAAGKARNLYHRVEVEKQLTDVILPGTSGILCLVSATATDEVTKEMPQAEEVKSVPVDAETATAVKAAAVAAGDKTAAGDTTPAAAG
jgi:uncharacterized membrane protein